MADNSDQVTATLTAEDQFTDWLQFTADALHAFSLILQPTTAGSWKRSQVTVQFRRAGQAVSRAVTVDTFRDAGTHVGTWQGPGEFRAGVKPGNFVAGESVDAVLQVRTPP